MYTVSISDGGMFTFEYVQPATISFPLLNSGSTVEIRKNEDLTYSALIDGQWTVITAETEVMAANGNVYRALLSSEGIPIGVMHVAAMQELMLGQLGGTVTVTQAEDMTWSIGDIMLSTDAENEVTGITNMTYIVTYVVPEGAEKGEWVAMHKPVYQTVALGTQGSLELKQAEDGSWWQVTEGNPAANVGTEVMSANGNTYTLWYTNDVWSARFEPESMMIEGTGLIAMTREGDDMYDVGDSTLPASGVGDVTDGDAMYHVWMQDGALMGARFDAAIDAGNHTRMTVNLGNPALSANDADTPGNELRTHLIVTGNDDAGKGMFSFGDLLGSGMASDEGARFVDEAVKAIEKVQADVSALLALDTKPTGLDTILEGQWTKLEAALDNIFGTASGDDTSPTSAVRQTAPREEDILDEIADILDALSSEASFVAATAEDGGGVFAKTTGGKGVLGAGGAADAFNRLTWSAEATLGMTGSTRYGTAVRKTSGNAKSKPSIGEYGAFSYATMEETQRTADAAAVSLTGIASYSGGTRAVSGSGKAYSGMMDLQVRFKANSVSGVVSGLMDADGLPWQHNFADVDRIVLDDGTLRRNAKWDKDDGASATIFYTEDSGLLRPVNGVTNTFAGILLGRGADAGREANGTWSVGIEDSTGYLAGGFGVKHVRDTARPEPPPGDPSAAGATLFSMATDTAATTNMTKATIGGGMLTVKQRSYGWTRVDATTAPAYGALGAAGEEVLITAKFDLAAMAEAGAGEATTINGPKWVDQVVATLTKERDLLSTLQGLNSPDTQAAERSAWQRVQDAVRDQMLGNLPLKLAAPYDDPTDSVTNELESEADAIDLINRALDALSSNANLAAALDPDGTGIFDHHDGNNDATADNFVNAAKTKVNNRTFGNMRGERTHQVTATLGTTSYTRFGVWRRQSTRNAIRGNADNSDTEVLQSHGGPGTFAYSPLDPTNAGTLTNPGFPKGGSASYTGETVAVQNTTLLTGTVRVDVTWRGAATTALTEANFGVGDTTGVGTMSLTISGLASPVGDPLSHGGSVTDGSESPGNEIADIVLGGFVIGVGGAGDNANDLIVGTADTSDATDVTYTEANPANARLRFSALGTQDNITVPATSSASAKALFVGQGVDGPLGVIGTWTVTDSGIARVSDDGTTVKDLGTTIYGAFGAQVP